MKALDIIVKILLIIGGLNWGVMGVSDDYNIIEHIFGYGAVLTHIIYILFGLSALYVIFQWKAIASRCK